MSDSPEFNPYQPSERGVRADSVQRGKWTATFKLLILGAGLFVGAIGFLAAGVFHYSHLQLGFDYQTQSSQELAQITAPAWYWLIPTAVCLVGSIVALLFSALLWLKSTLAG